MVGGGKKKGGGGAGHQFSVNCSGLKCWKGYRNWKGLRHNLVQKRWQTREGKKGGNTELGQVNPNGKMHILGICQLRDGVGYTVRGTSRGKVSIGKWKEGGEKRGSDRSSLGSSQFAAKARRKNRVLCMYGGKESQPIHRRGGMDGGWKTKKKRKSCPLKLCSPQKTGSYKN